MDKLNEIKDYILLKNTFFNNGFANVVKPDNKNIVLDENEREYVGICDNLGNYFYLRSLKKSTYNKLANNRYSKTTQCRIVVVGISLIDDILEQVIINSLVKNGCNISSSNLDKTSVFREETGTDNLTDIIRKMNIISIDFEIIEPVNHSNCGNLNPCKC